MADLRGDGRGQILLVAAFALAVIFVSLAIVANSAIYTENLATRGGSIDASDALVDRHAIQQAAGDTVTAANWNNQTGTYSTLSSTVDQSVQDLADWEGLHAARESTMVSTDLDGHGEGRRLVQTDDTAFTSSDAAGSASDWILATDVDRTRAFHVDVTDVDSGGPFVVNVTRPTVVNWTMSVDEIGSDVVVEVERESPDEIATCRVPAEYPVTIDVTGATTDGRHCPALDSENGESMHFGAGVGSPYEIRFENGDSVTGNYSLIVDGGATIPGNYGTSGGVGSQPYDFPAMYEAFVDLRYHSRTVDYETEIRVAPGEIDD